MSRGHDDHVRAAVELLIDHDCWLRRADFTRACVRQDARQAWIDWAAARRFVDAGAVASSSESGKRWRHDERRQAQKKAMRESSPASPRPVRG